MTKLKLAFWLVFAARLLDPLVGFAQKKPKIIVVTHGQISDAFWLVVRHGVETAAKETDSDVQDLATGQFDLPAMSNLIDAAVASKPDGLVVSIPDADSLSKSIQAAVAAKTHAHRPRGGIRRKTSGGTDEGDGCKTGPHSESRSWKCCT
jgi:ABC-type sugar transport system substrate-binding protein